MNSRRTVQIIVYELLILVNKQVKRKQIMMAFSKKVSLKYVKTFANHKITFRIETDL